MTTLPWITRAWRLRAPAALLACVLASAFASMGGPAGAASSGTVVTASVPSAVILDQQCTSSSATNLGTVLPDTTATTATGAGACQVSWTSSNDTSRLRMVMSDRTAPAMAAAANSWSNGRSGANMILGMHAYDSNVVFASGEGGEVIRTNNGGSSWVTNNIGTAGWVFDVEPEPGNNNRWVAVGGDGFVASTANGVSSLPGAATWTDYSTQLIAAGWPATADVNGVAVISASTWVIGGDLGWMARTVTGGTSWTVYQRSNGDVTNVDAVSSTEYVATTSWGNLLRTTTSGVNAAAWTYYNPSNSDNQFLTELAVGDATHVYAASQVGALYRWNGTSFDELPEANGMVSRLQSVMTSSAAPATLWVGGDAGTVFKSIDSGATWTRQQAPSGATFYAGAATSGTNALFGASNGDIVKTDGTTWSSSRDLGTYPPQLAVDADPNDGRIAVTVGAAGTAFRTTNKGSSWTPVTTGVSVNLTDVTFVTSQLVWAVGGNGTIIRSLDGGVTWSVRNSTGATLRSIAAADTSVAWAVGDGGTILRTANGGTSWTTQASGTTYDLVNVAALSGSRAAVLGGGNVMRRTVDGGATWTAPSSGTNQIWEGLVSQGSTTYLAATYFGRIYRSVDSGDTWVHIGTGSTEDVDLDIAGNTLVMAGFHGNTRKSTDGGFTWTSDGGVSRGLIGIAAVDANSQFLTKNTGSVWDTDESAVVANQVSDYAGGANFGSGSATSTFGVCLQSLTGATVDLPWVVDGGTCTATDTDPWRAVSATPMDVASATVGTTGTATFVFGFRPRSNQPPGVYTAGISFEAIAPMA